MTKTKFDIKKLTYLAILTALVVLLQVVFAPMIGAATGISPALVLIPIVLGVATCGIGAGAWLGGVFALIVMFDPTTIPFFEYSPLATVFLVFLKGIGSGLLSALIFKILEKKNKYIAIICAAIIAPIANTGLFVLGCFAFFLELTGIEIYTLFAGVQFAVELIVNAVFVPTVFSILNIAKK